MIEDRRMLIETDGGLVDAYLGVRSWRWAARDGVVRLQAVASVRLWPGDSRDVDAVCCCSDMQLRTTGVHTCGIYAWRWSDAGSRVPHRGDALWGEVALWGDPVHVHERGYRAQRARVTGFFTSPIFPRRVNLCAELAAAHYDVPIIAGGVSA